MSTAMSEILSIKNEELKLEANKSDTLAHAATFFGPFVAALTAAGLMGPAAPALASILGSAIAFVIPNQKIDRVVIGLNLLFDKVKYLEQDLVEEKLKTETFQDLLEDGVFQFARALTPERREYIANLLKNGLTEEELDHLAKKRLLFLLNELNDAEIIILYYYSLDDEAEREMMRQKYPFVPKIVANDIDVDKPPSEDPNQILYEQYQGQLTSLSLLYVPGKDYHTTGLANLLLRYIDVANHLLSYSAS